MSKQYSIKVLEHFYSPQNAFSMPDADAKGRAGDPNCGDYITVYLKIAESRIVKLSYQVFGCAASIATSSMLSVMAEGKMLDGALRIRERDVIDALDGLPWDKQHCSNLGVGALRDAIKRYYDEKGIYRKHILLIGTYPENCISRHLTDMIYEIVDRKDMDAVIRKIPCTDEEACDIADQKGLKTGSALDVAGRTGADRELLNIYESMYGDDPLGADGRLKRYREKAEACGILMVPILVIDGSICSSGRIPKREELIKWIGDEDERQVQGRSKYRQ